MFGFIKQLFHSRPESDGNFFARIKDLTGFTPHHIELYETAFRHRSTSGVRAGKESNERLEFLGDAILGAIVSQYLYEQCPDEDEGFLTSTRAKLVSRKNLNKIAHKLHLEKIVVSKLDKRKPAHSLAGDALEALIGALYLDRGLEDTRIFIMKTIIGDKIDLKALEEQIISHKSLFIEYAQRNRLNYEFRCEEQWGQNHKLTFRVALYINDEKSAEGIGTSKKRAEEEAAKQIAAKLDIQK